MGSVSVFVLGAGSAGVKECSFVGCLKDVGEFGGNGAACGGELGVYDDWVDLLTSLSHTGGSCMGGGGCGWE